MLTHYKPCQLNGGSLLRFYRTAAGLFGIPNLLKPGDFSRLTADTLARCQDLVQNIQNAPATAGVVRLMDDLSDELCRAYDAAECCRNLHSKKEWRNAAHKLCEAVGGYITEVNHHEGMYRTLKQALNRYDATSSVVSAAVASSSSAAQHDETTQHEGALLSRAELDEFTPELVMVGRKLLLDFEKAGIHLPPERRLRIQKLLNINNHFAILFKQNLLNCSLDRFDGTLMEAQAVKQPSIVDPVGVGKIPMNPTEFPPRWAYHHRLSLDDATLHSFLAAAPSEPARKKVYVAGFSAPAANLKLLDSMIATRKEIAMMLGLDSWTRYRALDSSLAGEPAAVSAFLKELAGEIKPLADEEVQALARLKAVHRQADEGSNQLEAWDVEYYKAQAAQQAAARFGWKQQLGDYLQLSSVMAGVQDLFGRLMGLQMELQDAEPGEGWAPEVRKLVVSCRREGMLGTILLDFATRPDKHPGSVLYPVRCGRQLPGGYQHPILVLATDFGPSPWGSALSWRQLRALMHELGHAVHNLVSQTTFQHLWGTRCAQDIVEVPSHLMELMVTDPRSAALLARHRSSRDPLPAAALQQLNQQCMLFPALDLQAQVLHALVDQQYFGAEMPIAGGGSSRVWADTTSSFSSVPHVDGTHPQARFSHLTVYGGCYYSYTFARCLSAEIWASFLEADPLDAEAGSVLRSKLLAPGGTLEPLDLFQQLLGPSSLRQLHGGWVPSTQHLLEASGLRVRSSAASGRTEPSATKRGRKG